MFIASLEAAVAERVPKNFSLIRDNILHKVDAKYKVFFLHKITQSTIYSP
jgi:hypothetical protein